MTAILLLGAGLGIGLTCVARGLWPPRPSLAQTLAVFRASVAPSPPPSVVVTWSDSESENVAGMQEWSLRRLSSTLRRHLPAAIDRLVPHSIRPDLAVCGVTPERHLAERVLTAVVGALTAGLLSAGTVVVAGLPVLVPLWTALVFGAIGFVAPALDVRMRARRRREEMQDVVAATVSVVSLSLSAGNGVHTALRDGIAHGDIWAWRQLRSAVDGAQWGTRSPWEALGQLGAELRLPELEELAARVRLAEHDGARIQGSLLTFAATLQSRRLLQVERRASRRTLEMSAACCVLAMGFTLLLVVPAFAGIMGS